MKYIIYIFFGLLTFACQKGQSNLKRQNGLIAYSVNDYFEFKKLNKKFAIIDTFCINEENRALKDARNGNLKYYFYANMSTQVKEVETVKKHFSKNNLNVEYAIGSCITIPEFNTMCYENKMREEFEKYYGKKFIDSIEKIRQEIRSKNKSR